MTMKRFALDFLQDWLVSRTRKPLILRGARQVGKTWLAREIAQQNHFQLVEINFENTPYRAAAFESNQPTEILTALEATLNVSIDPHRSLLFLDEIQAVPHLIAKLRWFKELLPELPVIAAGSLLEFTLAEHSFSMPVGRVSFAHIEPLSFEEFLLACKKEKLLDYLRAWNFSDTFNMALHQDLLSLFKEYLIVGGLPAAVDSWITERSVLSLSQTHQDILASYRSDFSKYHGHLNIQRLEDVLMAVPRLLGQKFVFAQVNPIAHPDSIKKAVDLLNKARVCHKVRCTAANGLPLAAESRDKFFKEIFLDVGLASSSLGLNLAEVTALSEVDLVNKGVIAEQVIGQLLRTLQPFFIEPELFYWQNEKSGSQAELDYLTTHGTRIIPIEVKAGASGRMRSLEQLMQLKKLSTAVRVYAGRPEIEHKEHYRLLSLPFYLFGQLHRLIDTLDSDS